MMAPTTSWGGGMRRSCGSPASAGSSRRASWAPASSTRRPGTRRSTIWKRLWSWIPGRIYHHLELAEIYADRKRTADAKSSSGWWTHYRSARSWTRPTNEKAPRSCAGWPSTDQSSASLARSRTRSSSARSRRCRRSSSSWCGLPARSIPSRASSPSERIRFRRRPGSCHPLRRKQQREPGTHEDAQHEAGHKSGSATGRIAVFSDNLGHFQFFFAIHRSSLMGYGGKSVRR